MTTAATAPLVVVVGEAMESCTVRMLMLLFSFLAALPQIHASVLPLWPQGLVLLRTQPSLRAMVHCGLLVSAPHQVALAVEIRLLEVHGVELLEVVVVVVVVPVAAVEVEARDRDRVERWLQLPSVAVSSGSPLEASVMGVAAVGTS